MVAQNPKDSRTAWRGRRGFLKEEESKLLRVCGRRERKTHTHTHGFHFLPGCPSGAPANLRWPREKEKGPGGTSERKLWTVSSGYKTEQEAWPSRIRGVGSSLPVLELLLVSHCSAFWDGIVSLLLSPPLLSLACSSIAVSGTNGFPGSCHS